MAIILKQQDEVYEVDSEKEAYNLVDSAKQEFDITRSVVTYKYRKKDDREYWVVNLRKNYAEEE